MKTKILFTSMVLPTLFAACTAEEFAENQNVSAGLEGRALLDPITVTIENGKPDSRFSWNEEKYEWNQFTAEDKFSAGLVDNINKVIGNDVLTNYIFSSEDGKSYSTTTQMVEGAYMFYSYTGFETSASRGPVKFDLTSQDQIDLNNPAATVEENKFFIAPLYRLDSKTANNNLGLEFVSYWSTAAIKIANTSKQNFKIIRMALVDDRSEFAVKGEISPVTIAGGGAVAEQNNFIYSYDEEKGEYVLPEKVKAEDFRTAKLYNDATDKVTKVDRLVVDCQSYVLEAGKDVTAYIQVPAGQYDGLKVEITAEITDAKGMVSTVTLDKEVVLNAKSAENKTENDKTQFSRGKTTSVFGIANNAPAAYEVDEIELITAPAAEGLYASSYDDMYEYLTDSNNKELTINNFGSLQLDNQLISLINRMGKKVTFVNPIEISSESKNAVELTNVVFKNAVTLVKGAVELGADVSLGTPATTVSTKETTIPAVPVTLVVNKDATAILSEGYFEYATIENNGTVEVALTNGQKVAKIDNKENAKVIVSGMLTVNTANVNSFNIPSTLEIAEGGEVLFGSALGESPALAYGKTIVNKGTLTMFDKAFTINGSVVNYGTIKSDNANGLFELKGSKEGNVEKTATIENYGTISGIKLAEYSNVVMKKQTAQITTESGSKGKINNEVSAFVTAQSDDKVYVIYNTNQTSVELGKVMGCNTIYVNDCSLTKVTIPVAIKNIELNNVTITSSKAANTSVYDEIPCEYVKMVGCTVNGNVKFTNITTDKNEFTNTKFNGLVDFSAASESQSVNLKYVDLNGEISSSKVTTLNLTGVNVNKGTDETNNSIKTVNVKADSDKAGDEVTVINATVKLTDSSSAITINEGAVMSVTYGSAIGNASGVTITNNGKVLNQGKVVTATANQIFGIWTGNKTVTAF